MTLNHWSKISYLIPPLILNTNPNCLYHPMRNDRENPVNKMSYDRRYNTFTSSSRHLFRCTVPSHRRMVVGTLSRWYLRLMDGVSIEVYWDRVGCETDFGVSPGLSLSLLIRRRPKDWESSIHSIVYKRQILPIIKPY